jgi:isopenicillin-N N-acyltransferase-like protein
MPAKPIRRYPHVRVAGEPRERGRLYGKTAAARVRRSAEAYAGLFHFYADISWDEARTWALPFVDPIERHDGRYLEEMRGIAEGAGLAFEDILALNLRTELMFAAAAERALHGEAAPMGRECSAIVALPQITQDGHTLLAQNWDWMIHTRDTVIVLEAQQDDGPSFVTVVEAGLLAKTGMNERGIGVVTNALVSTADKGEPGVPYHILLRSLMDAESLTDALTRLERARRSSSANYLVASAEGLAMNAECLPGGFSGVLIDPPRDGVFAHTNHFVSPQFGARDAQDVSLTVMPDSFFRLERLNHLLGSRDGAVSRGLVQRVLSDHAEHPYGICSHEDTRTDPVDQAATTASVVMDLDERRLWLADGNPCTSGYRELDYSDLLGASGGVPTARSRRRTTRDEGRSAETG